MKEFLSLWGFGEVWGIFPGYVGKIIESTNNPPPDINNRYLDLPVFSVPNGLTVTGYNVYQSNFGLNWLALFWKVLVDISINPEPYGGFLK